MYLHLKLIHIPDTHFYLTFIFCFLCFVWRDPAKIKNLSLPWHTHSCGVIIMCVCVWEHSCSSQASYVTYRAQAVDL